MAQSDFGNARWISLGNSASGKISHYSLEWDFAIQRLNAGFLFSGNTNHDTYYMWQINLEGGKTLLRPHICIGGNFTLYKEVDISKKVVLKQDEMTNHHLLLDVNMNIVTTTIDGVEVDRFQVPYDEAAYGEFGIREFGDEAAYFDNMKVTNLADPDNPVTLIDEDFTTYTALEGGLIVNGRVGIAGTTNWYVPHSQGFPVLRKYFTLDKKAVKAIVRASALGIYDLYINGQRVEGEELKPGWTDYRKEVAYQEFDVTDMVQEGDNAISAQLGRGWWAGDIAHGAYGDNPLLQFIAMLHVSFDDGTRKTILTNDTWKSAKASPVTMSDIYDGESYDGRISTAWRNADFDDSAWGNAAINVNNGITLFKQTSPMVTVRDEILWRQPISAVVYQGSVPTGTTFGKISIVNEYESVNNILLKKGQTMVVDVGQNMVGWVCFTAKGKEGTVITIRHGEMLNYNGDQGRLDQGPAGSVWTYNLRTADATLHYTMNGNAEGETYHPTTTFMGFRYVEMTATEDITLVDLVGQVVGDNIKEWGEFECSDSDINQLFQNVWWSQRGNFLSIPTDCPQRDERLGWSGDTQIFSRTAMYNSDATELYRQWMREMRNGQAANGAFRDMVPFVWFWGEGNAAWGDAGVIVPWTVYDMTGDKTLLTENYDAMKRWIEFCKAQGDGTWKYNGAGTGMGDWLSYEELDARYVSVCYFAYVAKLMQKAALALSAKTNDTYAIDAKNYEQLYEDIRKEWQTRYLNDSGSIKNGTQTSYLLALHLSLVPEDKVKSCRKMLRQKIIGNGYRLSTGFVGTGILCGTLSEQGMDDLAFALLQQRKNPSWLYSIDQGATTIWERWDSYTIENGFHQHPWNMNSFNHYSYGSVVEWMYAGICGIQTADYAVNAIGESGWRNFVLAPHVDNRSDAIIRNVNGERITWARAKMAIPIGNIEARWDRKDDGRIVYKVVIPPLSHATVIMPRVDVTDVIVVNGETVAGDIVLGAGSYTIECVSADEASVGTLYVDDPHAPVYDLVGRMIPESELVKNSVYIKNRTKFVKSE